MARFSTSVIFLTVVTTVLVANVTALPTRKASSVSTYQRNWKPDSITKESLIKTTTTTTRGGAKTVTVKPKVPKAALSEKPFDNGRNDLIAPAIYASYTGALIYMIYELRDAITSTTLGSKALAFVTGALIWDNMIISIGSLFFKDVASNPESNPNKLKILKTLSYPRFTLHSIGVPLQCITIAEMGKAAGVGFLQSDLIQMGVIALAIFVAIADRIKFAQSPGIELTVYDKPPFGALERDIVKFGYKVVDFTFVIPAIILALSNLIVGIVAMKAGTEPIIAKWMTFAGASALVGNALPGSINAFSGNLGEAGMQYGLLNAARVVYGGK